MAREHESLVNCLRYKSVDELTEFSFETPSFLTSMGPSRDGVLIPSDFGIDTSYSSNNIRKRAHASTYQASLQQFHSVWKSPKMSHLNFWNLAFSNHFCPIKSCLSGNTVWVVASVCEKLAKLSIFGIFIELLSTQNRNVACFARNVECDFFCYFPTLCMKLLTIGR